MPRAFVLITFELGKEAEVLVSLKKIQGEGRHTIFTEYTTS